MIKSELLHSWFLVSAMICFMTIAQLLFKMAAIYLSENLNVLEAWFFNFWLWAAMGATILATFFWLFALKHLPLSTAYPWTALIYVLTPLASMYIFNDILSLHFYIGMMFIITGVFISSSGTGKKNDRE